MPPSPIWPSWLWAGFLGGAAVTAPAVLAPAGFGRLLRPLTVIHPEWVGGRIETLTAVLPRFRDRPGALAGCFAGAIFVQGALVVFYLPVATRCTSTSPFWDLAVIVPLSFVVQMLPVSVNGFGVREAFFSYVLLAARAADRGSAVLMSLVARRCSCCSPCPARRLRVARGTPRRRRTRSRTDLTISGLATGDDAPAGVPG